jgi:peptide/nickel transport system substrate-binding protein
MTKRLIAAPLLVGLIALAGCGGSDNKSSSSAGGTPAAGAPDNAKHGGTLTILASGDVDYIDPGEDYYQFGYMVEYSVNRTLYSFGADDADARPDLATAAPEVSSDGKTITVHIRKGIKYAPPVNREVTSKDIKYAIERGFSGHVPSAYATLYFGSIVGAPKAPDPKGVPEISGITTPDDQTLVFKLSEPRSGAVIGAMALPLTVPVPQEYAKKFDAKNPSTYDQHVAFVGPYMVQHDASGKLTGRKPGKSITLVRNPNWDKGTDYRPAYLDRIEILEGNSDPLVSTRRILTGSKLVSGDFTVPANLLKRAVTQYKNQTSITQTAAWRAVSVNTKMKPFDNVNVRKALFAVFDRQAMILSRGGTAQGTPAWSFIPPDFPGFDESGGATPPKEFDFAQKITGDPALAQSYMKKAGYPSGKYTGSERPLEVGVAGTGTGTRAAEITQAMLGKLGIKVKLRFVTPDAYITKFCGVPKKVAVCPSSAWGQDFKDAQTELQPTFDGRAIAPANNANYSELDDPTVNAAIDKALALPPGKDRDQAWADVNKLVVGTAAAVPYQWDKTVNVESKDVAGVLNINNTAYDLNYTSLK